MSPHVIFSKVLLHNNYWSPPLARGQRVLDGNGGKTKPKFGSAALFPRVFASQIFSLPLIKGLIILNQLSHTIAVVVYGVTGEYPYSE